MDQITVDVGRMIFKNNFTSVLLRDLVHSRYWSNTGSAAGSSTTNMCCDAE